MKLIVNKALNKAVVLASLVLVACSAPGPSSTTEMATQGLYSAALSDNGAGAMVGSIQHGGSYWSTRRGERRFNWNHAKGEYTPLISVDIDPSGDYGVTGGARTLVLWNAVTGQSVGYWNTPGDIKSLKLTRNGDFALVGMDDQTARFFDVKNGGIVQTLRTGAIVRAVDVSPDGRFGLTGDDKYQVTLWDLRTGLAKYTWQLSNKISAVALSPDGNYAFAAAQLGNAKVWSTLTGRETSEIKTGELQSRNVTIGQATFSPDGRSLLLGQVNRRVTLVGTTTGTIQKSWDLHLRDTLRPTGASVLALAFGTGNTYYAIGSNGFLNVLK